MTTPAGFLHGVAYVATLVLTVMIGWAVFVFLPTAGSQSGFSLAWYISLPYLAAWALLTFRRPWLAVAFILILPGLIVLTSMAGFAVGLATIFFFGLPGVVAGAAMAGAILYIFHELDGRPLAPAWGKIHIGWAIASGIVFALLFFLSFGRAKAEPGMLYGLSPFLAVAFGGHALASWLQLRREDRGHVTPKRVVVLAGLMVAAGAFTMARSGLP